MKRALFALVAMTVIAGFSGCCCMDRLCCGRFWCRGNSCGGCGGGCNDCGSGDCGGGGCGCGGGGGDYAGGCSTCGDYGDGPMTARQKIHGAREDMQYAQGPPTGGVAYPYYTNRGPRDFLARNPRSIGP